MAGKLPKAGVWVLCAVLFAFAFQGSRHVWDPDEGRYTAVALNMMGSGDWVLPRLHDERLHFTKPPLTYWAEAASMEIFGKNEWAARLPNALAYLGTLFLLFLMAGSFLPGNPWAAPLVYGLSLLPWAAANLVTTDSLLALWETLAGFSFFSWWKKREDHGARAERYLVLFWSALGLAFLTKGPPGLMPLLGVLAFLLFQGGVARAFSIFSPPGLLVFGLVGLGWFAYVILKVPGLLDYLLDKEVLGRIFSGMHHRNSQWYGALVVYIPTLFVGTLPWTWILLRRVKEVPLFFRRSFWKEKRDRDPEGFFLLLWFLLPLPIFFLARSRLPLYLLPLFAPLSLLLAREAAPVLREKRSLGKGLVLWALLLVGVKGAAPLVPYRKDPVALAGAIRKAAGPWIKEVVFVNTKAEYGLSFYTGAEVERVDFGPLSEAPPLVSRPQTVLQELSEKEPDSLFLIRPWDLGRFSSRLALAGYKALPMGGFGKYRFFRARKKDT